MPCGAGNLEQQVKPDISYSETGFIEAAASLTVVDIIYRTVDINEDSR
jgi:hypothetical protein